MAEFGVISDTHGLLRPEALTALAGVDHILHLGDIGPPEILEQLRTVAPVTAIRGNVDRAPWTQRIPETSVVDMDDVKLYLIHDLSRLALDPAEAGFAAVLYGHTHQPKEEWRDGVLYLNPGSAGPRRFRLPICLARLMVDGEDLKVTFIDLESS